MLCWNQLDEQDIWNIIKILLQAFTFSPTARFTLSFSFRHLRKPPPSQVDVCCLQETNLNEELVFKIREYQCHRKERQKGGIVTQIKNNINACQLDTFMEGAEY
jgi:hypothetical protein